MADNSTTETGADQSSSGSQDESLLDNQQQSAEEQHDTGSGDSQSQDSDNQNSDGRQDDTTHDESSDDDEGLARFAKGQGFDDYDNLSEDAKRALKLARKQQQEFHKQRQTASEDARKAIDQVHQADENDELDDSTLIKQGMAQIRATQRLQDFYSANPDARDYDSEMGQILLDEAKTYGREAAQALAMNMPRLYREAKSLRGDNDAEAAREAGRREERTRIRNAQNGGGENSSASSRSSGSNKLTIEAIRAMSPEEYASKRDEIDAAMASGQLR